MRRSSLTPRSISPTWCRRRRADLLGQDPVQRFGHGAKKRLLLRFGDESVGEQAERSGERRVLCFVAHLAMLRTPRDQRPAGLRQPEEGSPHLVPGWASIGLLDGVEAGLLGLAKRRQPVPADVLVPALSDPLHSGR